MNNKYLTKAAAFFSSAFLAMPLVCAQENGAAERSAFWGEAGAYFNKQAFKMFELVDSALTENPPSPENSMTRKLALYNLDAMLHETKYDNSEPFDRFIHSRMAKVLADMSKPQKERLKIYKIYNDGFIARTKSVTIAFDLVRGTCNGQTIIRDSVAQELARNCDILFLTHNHGDHVDPAVVNMFLDAGKPVVAPVDVQSGNQKIRHIRSENIVDENIELKNGNSLKINILPGHQSEVPNNIYVVTTPEGKTIVHSGDQYHEDDINWIRGVKDKIPRVDILLVICWTNDMGDFIEGFAPKLVITGHENEMGHTIDHREAFWLTFQKMERINRPYLVMGWGEWYNF